MKKTLIVVDMQNDFISGSLGSAHAAAIVPNVVKKVSSFDGTVIYTRDTHGADYMHTQEGEKLPVVHCTKDTPGWEICDELKPYVQTVVDKPTFGSVELPALVKKATAGEDFAVELIGLCTDICVVSNTLLLKAYYPEVSISVDASCCAGVTPDTHRAALTTMGMCQIEVKNG